MRSKRVWARLLGVEHTVIEDILFDEEADAIVACVRPARGHRRRCGRCGRRCSGYDQGEGRQRWRSLDLGVVRAYLEADAPRVRCPRHGVVVAALPWARHGAGSTQAFEDTVAWLVVHTSKTAVAELLRVAWRTVGGIATRVAAEAEQRVDRFGGLTRIGIDEISHKKGHRYLTVVVDHDTGRLVWAAPGHDERTLRRFFDAVARSGAGRSLWSARTRPPGSRRWWPNKPHAPPCALTPSISSAGRPTRLTRCAARPGTPRAAAGNARWLES